MKRKLYESERQRRLNLRRTSFGFPARYEMIVVESMKPDVEQILRRIEATLLDIRGVIGLLHLADKDLGEILNLEKDAEERSSSNAHVFNAGVREVSKRQTVLAIAKTTEFPPTSAPTVLLVSNGEIVGEEIVDHSEVERLKGCPEAVFVAEKFVLYRDRVKPEAGASLFVFPPLAFPMLDQMDEVSEVVAASPTSLSDLYIKTRGGWNMSDTRLGTLLIGFNIANIEMPKSMNKNRAGLRSW